MRQIYNTAESPEMAFFEMMDIAAPASNSNSTPKVSAKNESLTPSGQSSSNRNTLRLSLANLLPSRLALYFSF